MDKFFEHTTYQTELQRNRKSNRPSTNKKTESVIKNTPTNKSSSPDVFTGGLYHLNKNLNILILLKLFQEIEEEGKF